MTAATFLSVICRPFSIWNQTSNLAQELRSDEDSKECAAEQYRQDQVAKGEQMP